MYRTQIPISRLRCFALSKGGKLLSTTYIHNKQLLSWKCNAGHVWEACWANVSKKTRPTWCPNCANVQKPSITTLRNYAASRQGRCISNVYINNRHKLLWECHANHQWVASWNDISNKSSWCPLCKRLKQESLCIESAKRIFGFSFNKLRIYYSTINTRSFFELDGYNPDNNIAIEYQGIQHYEHTPIFHKSGRTLAQQQKQDEIKRSYCKTNNINLIEVPYTVCDFDLFLSTYRIIYDK